MTETAIKLRRRLGTGGSRAHQCAHAAGRLSDQPEAVAANMVHVRIDGGDARCHGEHRLDGVAPLGKDRAAIFDGGAMRGSDNAAAMSGTVQIHSAPARK